MSKRMLFLVSLLVIASMVLTACGGGGAASKTIKIATQSPLSGDQSVVGVDIKRGAELGLEQMSAALTEMGFKIELAPFDDMANPDTGVANAKQIVSDPAILCVSVTTTPACKFPHLRNTTTPGWQTSRLPIPTPK